MDLQSNISGFTAMSGFQGLEEESATGTFDDKNAKIRSRKEDTASAWDKRSDLSFQSALSSQLPSKLISGFGGRR